MFLFRFSLNQYTDGELYLIWPLSKYNLNEIDVKAHSRIEKTNGKQRARDAHIVHYQIPNVDPNTESLIMRVLLIH